MPNSSLAIALTAVALTACGSPTHTPPIALTAPTPAPGSCHATHPTPTDPQAWEPDPHCTPGTTTGGLTLQQLCPTAHTAAIRPPTSYTDPLKRQQMIAYGFTDSITAHEEDHLIPLELGGSPRDPANLWPEPAASPNEKDRTENAAHTAVCTGRLTLADAQHQIATDWIGLGHRLGVIKQAA